MMNRHLLEKVETATSLYMLEFRDHKCWIATENVKINTNLHQMWFKLKITHLLKLISFTGQVKMTRESCQQTFSHMRPPGVNSAQIIYVHTRGAECREREHSRDLHGRALMTDRRLFTAF